MAPWSPPIVIVPERAATLLFILFVEALCARLKLFFIPGELAAEADTVYIVSPKLSYYILSLFHCGLLLLCSSDLVQR